MNAPLPLPSVAPGAKASIADALGARPTPANQKGPSFSEVMARQRSDQEAGSRPAESQSKPPAKTPARNPNPAEPAAHAENAAAGAIDEAVQTAAQGEAGALAVAAQTTVVLPQQALEIAAQAAQQVQLARGDAAAAASAMGAGAAVLTSALGAADAALVVGAPVAASAQQAQAAAAQIARDAEAALPVLTAAAKPGSAQQAAPAVPAAVQAPAGRPAAPRTETPRLAPEAVLPQAARQPQDDAAQAQTPLRDEVQAAIAAADPQFQAPQAGAAPHEGVAQALAAAQRPAAPIANPAAFAAPAIPLVMQVSTPVGGTHWGTELGQQMVVMSHNVRQGVQTAELRLDPPDLGPLRVSLNLADGVASASFVSAHASVRHAVEAAMPQLQQALAQAGISLGQTSVGEQSAQQEFAQQGGNGSQRGAGGAAAGAVAVADAPAAALPARNANALVDTFA